ncbi:MAG: V-type ATP synthase subunit K [Planctomycetota bacterium]
MAEFWQVYFLETGLGWAILGAIAAVMLGGIGSAKGIRIAAAQGAGVMSEQPELFGKLFPLMAMPGTQGIYGFIYAFLLMQRTGFFAKPISVSPVTGLGYGLVGLGAGVVFWLSAINQGQASAASINLTAKKPDQFGRGLILPALVEFYAMLALLASIFFLFFLEWPPAAQ